MKGLQFASISSGMSSVVAEAKAAGERCGTVYCTKKENCPFCGDFVNGQPGASQVSGYFTVRFTAPESGSLISLKIRFEFPTFFATSQDRELIPQLQELVPWAKDKDFGKWTDGFGSEADCDEGSASSQGEEEDAEEEDDENWDDDQQEGSFTLADKGAVLN